MKKKILLVLIGLIMVLAACEEEKVVKEKESHSNVDSMDSIYTAGDISISLSVSQEIYKQGETPVFIIRNDGKIPVQYTGSGTILEYLQDDVWVMAGNAVTLDELNVLEPGQKMEEKLSPSDIQQKGVYRVVFRFQVNKSEEKSSQKIAVQFSVDSP